MKLGQPTLRILRITLAAICVLCLGAVIYEWTRPHRMSVDTPLFHPDMPTSKSPGTIATWPVPSLDTYSEVVERPLFRKDRRPYIPEPPAGPEQTRDDGPDITALISLSGTVINENERIALIERKRDNKLQQIRQGEKFSGWTLDQIQADAITMQKGRKTRQIALRVKLSRKQAQPQEDLKPEETAKQTRMASPANTAENWGEQKQEE